MVALAWIIVLGACLAAQSLPASSPDAQRLDRAFEGIQALRPGMGCRDLFGFVLDAAAAGHDKARIARILEIAERMQDRDEGSRTYGNFRWYWRAEKPEDMNAVEFCMQQGILVWMLHRDRLGADGVERLGRLIRFSVEGIRRHRVGEGYTNIYLMKTWNCIAIGENAGRPDLAEEGYAMLDRWLAHTRKCGICEYNSPTYYGVDLECLGLIARHARRPRERAAAEAALRLIWTDIAANWFGPCQRLGGAHSRDYDYLTGHGHLDRILRLVGWMPADRPEQTGEFLRLCRWEPPADLRQGPCAAVPRMVRQRWGAGEHQTAAHYVGRSFSIGSAGASAGPEDKALAVNLAGGPKMPMMLFFMDARGDAYGVKKLITGGGHSKSHHIVPFITSVQRGPEVLMLASADPNSAEFRRRAPDPTCLLSHFVIPAAAEVWVEDRPARPAKDAAPAAVPGGAPVFIRWRDVAVGVRFVLALDGSGRPAPLALVNDGSEHGVMRLTATHAADRPTQRGTAAIHIRAAEGLDEAGFAAFRAAFAAPAEVKVEGGRIDVALALALAVGGAGTGAGAVGQSPQRLRIAADVASGKRIAAEGADETPAAFLLTVNGRDLGREVLGRLDVPAR